MVLWLVWTLLSKERNSTLSGQLLVWTIPNYGLVSSSLNFDGAVLRFVYVARLMRNTYWINVGINVYVLDLTLIFDL